MYRSIQEYINEKERVIIADRRALHKTPETAFNEFRTQEYIVRRLLDLGYDPIVSEKATGKPTGVIAELRCGDGPLTALRFDIDALAITETNSPDHLPSSCGFRSENNCMHACGHDGHIAIGLACADALMHFKSALKGTVRFIFQPAEEGCRGANAVTSMGWLDDADYFLSGHIVGREYDPAFENPDNSADIRKIDVIPGVSSSLATTKIDVSFSGTPCHASQPECGSSVIPAIASCVLAINGIPRNSGGATFVNIGRISAGESRNIIAGNGSAELEVRGSTTALNAYMEENVLRIIKNCCGMYNVKADIDILGRCPSLESSDSLHLSALDVCRSKLSGIRTADEMRPFKASEDAAVMMEKVKSHGGSAIFFLFVADTTSPLHCPDYDFDEKILVKAASVFCGMVLDICGQCCP
ncbi:MAG: amidohydrolase [Lachnospiraceae bacterium]